MAVRRSLSPIRGQRFSSLRLGALFLGVALIAGVALFQKDRIIAAVTPGETIAVHFAEGYRLQPYRSQAKVAGIPVGKVTAVDRLADGTSRVSVKVHSDVPAKLRSAPSARIRPTTLLGGNYYLDLVPGGLPGDFGGEIPRERTTVPVELDKVAQTFPPNTLDAAQGALRSLDNTLGEDTQQALDQLLASAPDTLGPAGEVLTAAQGTRRTTDLPDLVRGLRSTAATLTARQGELESSLSDLSTTSTVLGNRSADLADTIRQLPATLDSTKAGLARLDGTLDKLKDTADPARRVAKHLAEVLRTADPVLAKARPLVGDLKELVADARPLVGDLDPVARQATGVLDDIRGPVLDRVNGPIKRTVLSPYRGTGRYQNSGGDKPMYQELAHMLATVDRASSMTDANGASIAYHVGLGPGSLGGLPLSLEQLFSGLTELGQRQVGR
ncbi:MAG: MlaD family protein [Haloechinothrix sp.]